MHRTHPSRTHPSRAAFTIIELLVVVLIISVLVAIGLAVGSGVVAGGKSTQTRDLIKTLDQTLGSYQQTLDRSVPSTILDPRYPEGAIASNPVYLPLADAWDTDNERPINSVGYFVHEARRAAGVSETLGALRTENFRDFAYTPATDLSEDPAMGEPAVPTVLDAWGNPLRLVLPRFHGLRLDPEQLNDPDFLGPAPDGGSYFPGEIRRDPVQGDADGGLCINGVPYFYSSGPDGNPGEVDDNVYAATPRFQSEN
ncbi:MAG: prepilin-type N-terminal cleavage/methylation domain-containing protein [Planctomycetota bacterium]